MQSSRSSYRLTVFIDNQFHILPFHILQNCNHNMTRLMGNQWAGLCVLETVMILLWWGAYSCVTLGPAVWRKRLTADNCLVSDSSRVGVSEVRVTRLLAYF